jgi:predicted AlkP superfamily pyrophosphatase or phosphodiesterase
MRSTQYADAICRHYIGVMGMLLTVLLPFTASAQQPSWQTPPKLVVGVVVDQMRVDYIYRYWNNFSDGGFKRLIGEGAFLRNAHYTYVPTVTGPGHASIYTGSVPAYHGIVANERYDRASGKLIYCVKDSLVQGLGSPTAQCSPRQLLATTLSDEIERRTDRQSKTIGVALKDRSCILPIGRTGDAAFWYSSSGVFVSSTWYQKELPAWVNAFNARKLPQQYLHQKWEPLLPIEKYHQVLPDANPYEQELAMSAGNAFPYDLSLLSEGPAGLGLIAYTPWGNTLTTDIALAALEGEQMGKDNITDLLAISYSSTDILAHKMGPRAVEVEDMYIRLDRELARLLTELDKSVGAGKYTLFLTADHGAVDVPAYLKDLRGSAGYVDAPQLKKAINAMLKDSNTVDSVAFLGDGEVFFADRGGKPLDMVARLKACAIARMVLAQDPAVASVRCGSVADLIAGASDQQTEAMHNGYMAQRSGDVQYALRPGFFEAEGVYAGKGTTHSSGWNYDTNVPVLFFGQGISKGEVVRRTAVADIVPTVVMVIGCALPDAAVVEPVREVVGR